MLASALRMSRTAALQRTKQIARHMSSSPMASDASPILSESNLSARTYALNRPRKLNALNQEMLSGLSSLVEEWSRSELCGLIIGTGVGRAFCAGGDVADAIQYASNEQTRHHAIDFFKQEYELDFLLAVPKKPYVAVCDGITMGGGLGLVAHAPFRVATERTVMAMPETKIGFSPDVGANHFLSRLDGALGSYMALTGNSLRGRAAFLHGLATHYVPSRRIPQLLSQLTSLDNPTYDLVNTTIEEYYEEPQPTEVDDWIKGDTRVALDKAFSHNTVEEIFETLTEIGNSNDQHDGVRTWAWTVLSDLEMRSPTSLKVALEAIRRGATMSLEQTLQMELNTVTAYINGASPDFQTGVTAVVVEKEKGRPAWRPDTLDHVSNDYIEATFFNADSPFLVNAPKLDLANADDLRDHMEFALPSEAEIAVVVQGSHRSSGSFGLSLEELVTTFVQLTKDKHGVREKIIEVASRCCEIADDPDRHHHLRWKL